MKVHVNTSANESVRLKNA
jgi:hypothetical protein